MKHSADEDELTSALTVCLCEWTKLSDLIG